LNVRVRTATNERREDQYDLNLFFEDPEGATRLVVEILWEASGEA
jgi:hypothetical protein